MLDVRAVAAIVRQCVGTEDGVATGARRRNVDFSVDLQEAVRVHIPGDGHIVVAVVHRFDVAEELVGEVAVLRAVHKRCVSCTCRCSFVNDRDDLRVRNHVATEVCSSPSACHCVAVGAVACLDGFFELHSHIRAVVVRRQHSRFGVCTVQRHVLGQLLVEDGCRFVDDGDDLLVAVAVAAGIFNVPVARHRVAVGAVAGQRVCGEDDLHVRAVV